MCCQLQLHLAHSLDILTQNEGPDPGRLRLRIHHVNILKLGRGPVLTPFQRDPALPLPLLILRMYSLALLVIVTACTPSNVNIKRLMLCRAVDDSMYWSIAAV